MSTSEGVKSVEVASPRFLARLAGFLYLLIILGSLFIPMAVPAPSGMMPSDATLPAADQILASKSRYVFGGIAQMAIGACEICVALIFYQLLKPVNRSFALLAAFFRLVFVAIANVNVLNQYAPLVLLSGTEYRNAFKPDQLQALASLFLKLRIMGFDIALVFFGFHCVLVGYLLFKSTFFPRILGTLLAIGGVGYLANIFAPVVPPAMRPHLFPYVMLPAGIAEVLLTFWLMIVGVNASRWAVQANAAGMLTGAPDSAHR